jgi:Uma2 family endonuclease
MRLQAADDVFYYPDVMAVCSDNEAGDGALHQHALCLIVEITSPSTESIDRREKVFTYRKIPSLQAYLIGDQDRRWVERHWRDRAASGDRAEWPMKDPSRFPAPKQVSP